MTPEELISFLFKVYCAIVFYGFFDGVMEIFFERTLGKNWREKYNLNK